MRIQNEDGVISIQINGRWKKAGVLRNNVFCVDRDIIEHFSKKHEGYGFNYELVKDTRFGDTLQINETDHLLSNTYVISRVNLLIHGLVDTAQKLDRQIYLSRKKMIELSKNC